MGKPLIHMIPSQEATLRKAATTNTSGSSASKTSKKGAPTNTGPIVWKGRNPPATVRLVPKGSAVKRSSTNASNESGKSSKTNSSNETGISSFVHSNASISSSDLSRGEASPHVNTAKKNSALLVPDSITTSASSSSKVRLAIQNYEQSIEVTRQNSSVSSSPSISSMSKTSKASVKSMKQVKQETDSSWNAPKQEDPKFGDETTISSTPSQRSGSFDDCSSKPSIAHEDMGAIPRFEVLLEDIPETKTETEPTAVPVTSPKLTDVPEDSHLSEQQHGFEVDFSSTVVNPTLVLNRRNSRSAKGRRNRQRQLSGTSSSQFFSAMDKHVATRRGSKVRSRRNKKLVQSIEVVQKAQKDKIVVSDDMVSVVSESNSSVSRLSVTDLNRVLSPSKMQGVRQSAPVTTAYLKMPPLPPKTDLVKKKKKIYTIEGGELKVNQVDIYEAIEVKSTGSVIVETTTRGSKGDSSTRETVIKPYSLVRMEETNIAEVIQKSRSKARHKSSRKKSKRSKTASMNSRNPIKMVTVAERSGAIELLRTNTNAVPTNAFSYDENEEDTIIRRVTPPPSPIPPVESLRILGAENDIEVVAPTSEEGKKASTDTNPPASEEPIERIVSIQKLSSQEEYVGSIPSEAQIKITPRVRTSSLKETSTPPKKFEPVVETPSNRVEEIVLDVSRADSYSNKSAASMHSISGSKSSVDCPQEASSAIGSEAEPAKNGDLLVYNDSDQSITKIENAVTKTEKSVFIPKIPAPKKDTTSKKHVARKISLEKAEERSFSSLPKSRKVDIQVQSVQKPDGNTKNIEVSSVRSQESTKPTGKVSSLVKKYSGMVVKNSLPAKQSTRLSESKHIVHVNVLGVAGIVVDRKSCRDITGNDLSPSPPEQMTAVVSISEPGQESVDDVTTFSSTLVHAPNTKGKTDADSPQAKHGNGAQRHIAVWASNDKGETPGSLVTSKTLSLNSTDKKFLNLNVALAKSGEDILHAAVVIGRARIEITDDMMNGNNNETIDVPVRQVAKEVPSLSSDVMLLRSASRQPDDFRKLRVEEFSNWDNQHHNDLTSAYAIDPTGDSMIRIQVQAEKVKQDNTKQSSSFTGATAATERSDESSIPSGASPEQTGGEEMYSKPLDFHQNFEEDATFHTVFRKGKILTGYEALDEASNTGCGMFGEKIELPNCTPPKKALVSDLDDDIADIQAPKKDDPSISGDGTHYTSFSNFTGSTKKRKLFDEMKAMLGPVPSMAELREIAQEIALSGGEFFFPEDAQIANEGDLEEDDDDESTGVESATLAALSRDKSWKKKRDDDDNTYSSGSSDNDSAAIFSLNNPHFHQEPVQFSFDAKRRVMSENNKFDIDNDNNYEDVLRNRSFCPKNAARLDMGFEGDGEDSVEDNHAALVKEIVDEENNNHDLRRQSSGKPSLPSVVENIAEVLSIGGKACGYFSTDKVDHGTSTLVWQPNPGAIEIPKTVDQSDNQSVGDLTAITLEKDEMKEKNRKLLMKRLGLPKDILSFATGGRIKGEAGDGEESSQSQSNSSKTGRREDYFAEYDEGTNGVHSIYGNNEVPKLLGNTVDDDGDVDDARSLPEDAPEETLSQSKDADKAQVESV